MAYENYACVNPKCELHGQRGAGNIAHRCMYGKEKDRELLYCKSCGQRFSAERQTIFKDTRLPKRLVYAILQSLCSGAGIRGTERNVGVHRDTVMRVKKCAAQHFDEVNKILIKDLQVNEIQLDEFWSFIKKKKKTPPKKRKKQNRQGIDIPM